MRTLYLCLILFWLFTGGNDWVEWGALVFKFMTLVFGFTIRSCSVESGTYQLCSESGYKEIPFSSYSWMSLSKSSSSSSLIKWRTFSVLNVMSLWEEVSQESLMWKACATSFNLELLRRQFDFPILLRWLTLSLVWLKLYFCTTNTRLGMKNNCGHRKKSCPLSLQALHFRWSSCVSP